MKPKYHYFIICNCNQPIMFNPDGRGQWVAKNGRKIDSDYPLSYILDRKEWKPLQVNRREFFKFAKSENNKTITCWLWLGIVYSLFMKIKVSNIKYDTDGLKVKLPKALTFIIKDGAISHNEIENIISNKISDRTGFCHFGFNFRIVR